jgi:hypothetical protein
VGARPKFAVYQIVIRRAGMLSDLARLTGSQCSYATTAVGRFAKGSPRLPTTSLARAVRTRVVARTMPRLASRPEGSRRPSAAVRFRLMLASASRTHHRTGGSGHPPPLKVMVAHVWRSSCWSAGFTSMYLELARGRRAHLIQISCGSPGGLRLRLRRPVWHVSGPDDHRGKQ